MAETRRRRLRLPPTMEEIGDEPLTPVGRMFVKPDLNITIHFIIGVENDIDVGAIKTAVQEAVLAKHSRFSSLLVKNGSKQYWRKTEVDVDRHVIIINLPPTEDTENKLNEYVADLTMSTPLSRDKPLWEIHLIPSLQSIVFRIHHAIGDMASLMSLLYAMSRKLNNQPANDMLKSQSIHSRSRKKSIFRVLCSPIKTALFSLRFCSDILLKASCVPDHRTAIWGGEKAQWMSKKLVTAKFLIEDMAVVRTAVRNATINDVLLGVVSAGLSKYLDHWQENRQGLRITGLSAVNLRKPAGILELQKLTDGNPKTRWGNVVGMIQVPMQRSNEINHPLDHLRRIKKIVDAKKHSIESSFLFMMGKLLFTSSASEEVPSGFKRLRCNTTFTVSNMMGPEEKISILGNPIKFIRFASTGSYQALSLHFVSYCGKGEMQIQVAKDIISDPEFLAKCFEVSLLEMKQAAAA